MTGFQEGTFQEQVLWDEGSKLQVSWLDSDVQEGLSYLILLPSSSRAKPDSRGERINSISWEGGHIWSRKELIEVILEVIYQHLYEK